MAIEKDTTSSKSLSGSGDTLTWSHTVGSGSNTVLVVCVPAVGNNPSSVKYNGEDLTQANYSCLAAYRTASIWYIVSPATGTNDITVNYNGDAGNRFGMAISLFGVNQNNPVGAAADSWGYENPSVDITTEKDNSYIIDSVAIETAGSVDSAGTGQTIIDEHSGRGASSYKQLSTAGETTMSWTLSDNDFWVAVAVEFKEVPSTKYKNFAKGTLTAELADDGVSLTITTEETFPQDGEFMAVIWDSSLSSPQDDVNREIVKLEWNTDHYDVTRAQEDTVAKTWASGSYIGHVVTAAQYNKYEAKQDTLTEGAFVDGDKTKLDNIEESADVTDATNVASTIHGVSEKTTPVDADEVGLIDSAASNVLKKLTWSNIKATLQTYFDTLYTGDQSSSDFNLADLGDVNNTAKAENKILKVDGAGNHIYADDESGTDEKVKYDAEDGTAGYVADKIIAGTGISVAEGTGGDTNKLVITNKRATKRVWSATSDATPDINSDDYDAVTITAQAEDITDVNVTGTPTNFQTLIFRIKDDGTEREITWGSDFESKGKTLPTTTIASKVLTVGFIYDTVTSKWGCVASAKD